MGAGSIVCLHTVKARLSAALAPLFEAAPEHELQHGCKSSAGVLDQQAIAPATGLVGTATIQVPQHSCRRACRCPRSDMN